MISKKQENRINKLCVLATTLAACSLAFVSCGFAEVAKVAIVSALLLFIAAGIWRTWLDWKDLRNILDQD